MADRLGQQFGNYQLIALLGQGGYAEVYLGQHMRLELQAAIKVLHGHLSSSEAERFQQEAQTMERLTHPSIVRVFDFDVQDGIPFLVMEYAPNGSLRQRYPEGSILSLPQIIPSIKQVAAALQYAHEHKFIHRDVKPENMLLGRQQEVLLSDFGLAALARSTSSLNTQGTVGTIAYIAPEQIEGHPRAASDQYALAVVIYEWLCGVRPFDGSATEVVVKQLGAPPPPLRERVPTISAQVEQVVLRALAKNPKERFASVAFFAAELERASQLASSHPNQLAMEQPSPEPSAMLSNTSVAVGQAAGATEATSPADQAAVPLELAVSSDSSQSSIEGSIPHSQAAGRSSSADVSLLPQPAVPVHRRDVSRITAGLLIGLVVLVIAGTILGSVSLLANFGVLGTHSGATTAVVRGGTWTADLIVDPGPLIPNMAAPQLDRALYLPLFYGDGQGIIHPAAAAEVPTVQNGGVSADAKTWTFHLRPHLVWTDGAPYDARDVDFTWKLWLNPQFGGFWSMPSKIIKSAEVSADHLSITFHLSQAYAPFLSYWVDGFFAPLPAHHFRDVPPDKIATADPTVTSGPFMIAESVPGDHYTLVRNPRYYLARAGLPYLDKVVFRVATQDAILKDLQAGTIDSVRFIEMTKVPLYQRLSNYTLVTAPTNITFEAMYFNFHNQVLASHLEVRQAMAMAIDHQALIKAIPGRLASLLCTDHGPAYHPGYDPNASCPVFDPAAANKLLSDNGWVKGSDGVRARNGQRLEFNYSTAVTDHLWRFDTEPIIQRNLRAIGIKLDIENYATDVFWGSVVPAGKASPPSGAVAGRYDIAEGVDDFGYDPDDSVLLACDRFTPKGRNYGFYCNPALDALYQQEQATVDAGARQAIFRQIHQFYLTQFPFITLYGVTGGIAMVHKGTHNYQQSPFTGDFINIWQWWCDKGKC
jgi:peptide/nickel transport system substrate-binding protein